jgi:hypothetical protein
MQKHRKAAPADEKPRHWIGVVGRKDSWERLQKASKSWWCLSREAGEGDKIAMYLTLSVSEADHGVFAFFVVRRIDPTRNQECRGFGSLTVGGRFDVFAEIVRVGKARAPVKLGDIKKDPMLRQAAFVRRNLQGTVFPLNENEYERLLKLAKA